MLSLLVMHIPCITCRVDANRDSLSQWWIRALLYVAVVLSLVKPLDSQNAWRAVRKAWQQYYSPKSCTARMACASQGCSFELRSEPFSAAGWAVSEGERRRGFTEELRLSAELAVTTVFDSVGILKPRPHNSSVAVGPNTFCKAQVCGSLPDGTLLSGGRIAMLKAPPL